MAGRAPEAMEMGETETDHNKRADYVPVKERKLDNKLLKPQLAVCPGLFPELRDKLYKWYPGPEIMMHRMHWTEWLYVMFLASSIALLVVGADNLPTWIYGVLLASVSGISLIMVWGFAMYKSLADAAERLERLAMENHAEVNAYEEINNEWSRGLKDSQDNLNKFAAEMGLVEDDATKIDEMANALSKLVTLKKKIQAEERALFQIEVRHQKVTRDEIDEKNRINMKKTLARHYDRIAKKGSSARQAKTLVDDPDEILELKAKLRANEFLNQRKVVDGKLTDEPMFNWLPAFEEIASDGCIQKWELLDALDEVTESYFLEIRDAIKNRNILKKELASLQEHYAHHSILAQGLSLPHK